jgi:hypothetical protein
MPREFYPDTKVGSETGNENDVCLEQIKMWDGPGICVRARGHRVDEMNAQPNNFVGEFHQEGLEGWVWDDSGRIG